MNNRCNIQPVNISLYNKLYSFKNKNVEKVDLDLNLVSLNLLLLKKRAFLPLNQLI